MEARRTLAAAVGVAAAFGPIGYLLFFRRKCLTWDLSP